MRADGTGKSIGGGLISRGHLYKILSNPIYLGRLTHKGQAHDGLHDPIVDQETWDGVQRLLRTRESHRQAGSRPFIRAPRQQTVRRSWQPDEPKPRDQGRTTMALLCFSGGLAGPRAPRRDPSPACQRLKSSQGRRSRARGLVRLQSAGFARSASAEGERQRRANRFSSGAPERLRSNLTRDNRARRHLSNDDRDEFAEGMTSDDQNRILIIPWTPPSPHRRREIIQGEGERPSATRSMRTEARAVLTDALRDAHRWLDELTTVPNLNIVTRRARRQNRTLDPPNHRSLSFAPPWSTRRSTVDCLAASGSSA